nr:MAG TPA: hypothetical protein [Caudoviricetes sp.]
MPRALLLIAVVPLVLKSINTCGRPNTSASFAICSILLVNIQSQFFHELIFSGIHIRIGKEQLENIMQNVIMHCHLSSRDGDCPVFYPEYRTDGMVQSFCHIEEDHPSYTPILVLSRNEGNVYFDVPVAVNSITIHSCCRWPHFDIKIRRIRLFHIVEMYLVIRVFAFQQFRESRLDTSKCNHVTSSFRILAASFWNVRWLSCSPM